MSSRPRAGGVRGTGASQGRWQRVRGGTVWGEGRRPLVVVSRPGLGSCAKGLAWRDYLGLTVFILS
jgi:hypothetical protein